MNIFDKIVKSWWVILSFIMFINGVGFIYIGSKHNNRNWIIEGVIYEIPWFFFFVYGAIYGFPSLFTFNPTNTISLFAELLMFVGIIRSIWVAIKLWNVYDNTEKYAQNPTELNNPNKPKENSRFSSTSTCCLCIAIIFFIFAIISIF
jgi:hypothetical protein